jgi:hypothetical protein
LRTSFVADLVNLAPRRPQEGAGLGIIETEGNNRIL